MRDTSKVNFFFNQFICYIISYFVNSQILSSLANFYIQETIIEGINFHFLKKKKEKKN